MRKFISVLLCLFMLLTLFSCEMTNDKHDISTPNETDCEPPNETDDNGNENKDIMLSEAEKAMEMYESVLKNEVKVYETDIEEYSYLKDCKTPYDRIPLTDCEQLKYAYTDIDHDRINELVLDCGDTLILRYYEGTVYVYSFTFRNMYYLHTDGSYAWNHTGENFEYGESRIYFEGAELKTKKLYRVVNDGEPNAEYYIEEKQATQEELQNYIGDTPKATVEFFPLEVPWRKIITCEEALEIASEYWGVEDGFTDYGAGSMWICRFILLDPPSSTGGYYHIGLQTDHYGRDQNDLRVLLSSSMKHLFVGSVTGKCQDYAPSCSHEAMSGEEALEIAEEYWYELYGIRPGDTDSETGYPYAIIPQNSDHTHYRFALSWLVEGTHFSTLEIIYIDAFTGEITDDVGDKG